MSIICVNQYNISIIFLNQSEISNICVSQSGVSITCRVWSPEAEEVSAGGDQVIQKVVCFILCLVKHTIGPEIRTLLGSL